MENNILFNENGNSHRKGYVKKNDISLYNEINVYNFLFGNIIWSQKLYNFINKIKEPPKCPICGTLLKFQNFNRGYSKYCSAKCFGNSPETKEKWIQASLKKYGTEYPMQNKEFREEYNKKIKETYGVDNISQLESVKESKKEASLKKYGTISVFQAPEIKDLITKTIIEIWGVENVSQSEIIKQKKKETLQKNYGVDHYSKTEEFHKQMKETSLKNFGVEHPMQNEEVLKKSQQTCLEHYGVEYPSQNEEVKEKTKQTNIERYGFECVLENEEIKEKARQTNIDRYGTEFPMQNEEVKNKGKQTNLIRYGTEIPMQVDEVKRKMINTMIERYGEAWVNQVPNYNPNSIIYLDMISKQLGLKIQHALNGGEKKFVRYWSDGYINEYNISLEWDEAAHNGKKQKEKDLKKEKFLLENYNCPTIRINQKEFLKDIEGQIKIIIAKINKTIDNLSITI